MITQPTTQRKIPHCYQSKKCYEGFAGQIRYFRKALDRWLRLEDSREAYCAARRLARYALNTIGREDGRGVQSVDERMWVEG